MKNKLFAILAFITIPWCVFSQNTYMYYSSHTTQLIGPELTVYQYAGFTIGAGSTCPPIDSFWVARTGNRITIDVLYNTLGVWPAQGCLRVDTLMDTITPCYPCELVVNAHTIQAPNGILDTFWYEERDTSYFSYLSSFKYKLEGDFEVYPNPASGFLYLKGEDLSNSVIKLLDISGREVRLFDGNTRMLDLQGIKQGVYCVRVESEDGRLLVRKVIVD